jgi:hypothetical protein
MARLAGSCHCGAVRFEVTEDFSAVRVCHCTTCKKLSGGVGTTNGRARTDTVRVVEGEELIRTYQPDEGSSKSFCSQCGSNLFGGGWPESEYSSVRVSAIDSPFDRKPEAHTWVRSVAAWEVLPEDGLDRFETTAGG